MPTIVYISFFLQTPYNNSGINTNLISKHHNRFSSRLWISFHKNLKTFRRDKCIPRKSVCCIFSLSINLKSTLQMTKQNMTYLVEQAEPKLISIFSA